MHVAPGRPHWTAGLRGAIATSVPLALAFTLDYPDLAVAGLAGYSIVLADKGGAYRTRAKGMWSVILGGGLATALGTWTALHTWPAVAVLLVGVSIFGLLRLFGAQATSVGTVLGIALVIAPVRPAADLAQALHYASLYMLGATWAAVLSLSFWPLRLYRPTRIAIAQTLRGLCKLAYALPDTSTQHDSERHQLERRAIIGQVRNSIELARSHLASMRRGRIGPSRRGEHLLALVSVADLILGALVAMDDSAALSPAQPAAHIARWQQEVASYLRTTLTAVAESLETEKELTIPLRAPAELVAALREATESESAYEAVFLLRALERAERLAAIASGVDGTARVLPFDEQHEPGPTERAAALATLRAHLTLDSAIFRHTLRTTLATTATRWLVDVLAWDYGHWATLTCFIIMQPHGVQTWAKALQRVGGTVLGAAVALVMTQWIQGPLATVACVFTCVLFAMSMLPLNYGVFTACLTPAFILLAETRATEGGVIGARLSGTLLGAGIALLSARLLFPLSERDQIHPLLGKIVTELEHLLTAVANESPAIAEVRRTRRALGIALLNAEASYQRLLTETGISSAHSEALLTLLLYFHRITSGLIAITFARGTSVHRHLIARAPELRTELDEIRQLIQSPSQHTASHSIQTAPQPASRVDLIFEQAAVLRAASLRLPRP